MDWRRACGCGTELRMGVGAGAAARGDGCGMALRMGMGAGAVADTLVVADAGRGRTGGATEKPPETGRLFHRVGWDWGDSYFISSSGVFFHLMRPCPASDNTVSRSVVRISRAW